MRPIKFFTDSNGNAVNKKPKGQKVSATPVVRDFIPIQYYESELEFSMDCAKGYSMIFDIESYVNYFLIGFKCIESGKYITFEDSPDSAIDLDLLNRVIWSFRLIGFNSTSYDVPMLFLALRGYKAERLKQCSNILIPPRIDNKKVYVNVKKEFNLNIPFNLNHIDIKAVCPLDGSLKKYSARIHLARLQDLPFDPQKVLTFEEAEHLKNYCLGSDIVNTEAIFKELSEQFKLRYDLTEKYDIDLRSKSDAQIAEAVIKSEVKKKTGRIVKREVIGAGTQFQYKPPAFLKFNSVGMLETFQTVKDMIFEITEESKLSMPDSLLDLEMKIGKTVYKFGKGGLHSKEKNASYKAENGMLLVDIDVESFYPRLILNSGLYPEAIGPIFLEIFNELVEKRIVAKAKLKELKSEKKKLKDLLNELDKIEKG